MGISLRNIGKKLTDFGSRAYDQVNMLDNGRTWQQRTPTNNRSVLEQATRPVVRTVQPLSTGYQRSIAGLGESLGGLYDLATPGLGTNRFTKNFTVAGQLKDIEAKQKQYNPLLYKGGQFSGELAQIAATAGLGNLARGGQLTTTKVVPRVLPRATSVTGKTVQFLKKPGVVTNIASNVAQNSGFRTARGIKNTPEAVALDTALSVAIPATVSLVGQGATAIGKKAANKIPEVRAYYNPKVKKPNFETKLKEQPSVPSKGVGLATEIKRGLSDKDQVILDELRNIEKQTGQKGFVDKFMYNSNMQRGSNARANVELTKSQNVQDAIGGMNPKEYKEFSDYANARTELSTANKTVATSRSKKDLKSLVSSGNDKFGARFEALNRHYKDLAQEAYNGGLISKETLDLYTSNNDYIRLQKDMGDLVQQSGQGGSAYSIGSTVMNQKRKGSSRINLNAGEVAAEYTQQVYKEVARNKTATQLADTLNSVGLAEKLDDVKAAKNQNVMRVLRDGKTEYYRVSPDIKQAVDNINPYHMNVVMKIMATPGRVLRAGVTGLNPVFIARNVVKDQFGSAINSDAIARTHNPVNFFRGLFNATTDAIGMNNNPLYDDFLRHYGDQTSFDLTRNTKEAGQVINRIRGGKTVGIGQAIKAPIRTLENFASITEKSTRFQNYVGEYKKAIASGLDHAQASEKAAMAAWQNSVDFSRAGTWGRAINTVIPYWNPATQGVRQMTRTFTKHPIKSGFTATALVGVPLATATAWNLSSPDTAAVYANIPEYEKENNLILVPPGTTQNKDGSYDIIKIPLPPGYKDIFMPIRRALEAYHNDKPVEGTQIAQDLLQSISGPVNTQTKASFVGSFIPQAAKPGLQWGMNKDLFTGKQTIPDFINQATDAQGNPIPESKKATKYTSGTARIIGDITNSSPMKIEKAVKDVGGTVGQNVLNAVDSILAKKGKIPQEQIGGQSVGEGFKRSFEKVQGIENTDKSEGAKFYDAQKKFVETLTPQETSLFNKINPAKKNFLGEDIYNANKLTKTSDYGDLIANPAFAAKYKAYQQSHSNHDPLWDLTDNQLRSYMQAQVISKNNPGGDSKTVSALYDRLPSDFFTKREQFFSSIKKTGTDMSATDYNKRPKMPDYLVAFSEAYHKLPYGTGARSAALRSKEGLAYIDYLNKNKLYNNQERADLGLPPLEDTTSKWGYGSNGKSKKAGSLDAYKYALSTTTGGSAAPKVGFKVANKSVRIARRQASKPTVSIRKSKV